MSTDTDTETWLHRVQALIAKAEATPYPDEAEAFMAKAQELMARHAIDQIMLDGVRRGGRGPESKMLTIPAPYATAKATLLNEICHANGVRLVLHGGGGKDATVTIVGFPDDLESSELLFAALLVHGARQMMTAAVPAGTGARAFRHAFMLGFATRIGERLREAAAAARSDYEAETGTSTALAMRDQSKAVDDAFRAAFPNTVASRRSSSSAAGAIAGKRAANSASLGQPAVGGSRAALRG